HRDQGGDAGAEPQGEAEDVDQEPETPHLRAPRQFGNRLAARAAGLPPGPVTDPLFTLLPAPEPLAAVELAVEIDEAFLEALEDAADLLELDQVAIDLPRHCLDLHAQVHLLGGLTPLGIRLGSDELVTIDEIAPDRMEGGNVRHDFPHQGQGAVGVVEGEVFLGHRSNLNRTWILRGRSA